MLAAASSLTLGMRVPATLRSSPVRMEVASAAGVSQLQLDQDRAIASRAEKERSLLRLEAALPLEALVQRACVWTAAAASVRPPRRRAQRRPRRGRCQVKGTRRQPPRSVLGKELQKNGVVRINGALAPATADALREFVDAERLRASAEVEEGRRRSDERFANLVLLSNRCDLLLPLDGPPVDAMAELLGEGSVLVRCSRRWWGATPSSTSCVPHLGARFAAATAPPDTPHTSPATAIRALSPGRRR